MNKHDYNLSDDMALVLHISKSVKLVCDRQNFMIIPHQQHHHNQVLSTSYEMLTTAK